MVLSKNLAAAMAVKAPTIAIRTKEGGNDAARVDGGMIRDVIDDVAEDEVVCACIELDWEGIISRLEDSLCFGFLTARRAARICLQSKWPILSIVVCTDFSQDKATKRTADQGKRRLVFQLFDVAVNENEH